MVSNDFFYPNFSGNFISLGGIKYKISDLVIMFSKFVNIYTKGKYIYIFWTIKLIINVGKKLPTVEKSQNDLWIFLLVIRDTSPLFSVTIIICKKN